MKDTTYTHISLDTPVEEIHHERSQAEVDEVINGILNNLPQRENKAANNVLRQFEKITKLKDFTSGYKDYNPAIGQQGRLADVFTTISDIATSV